MFIEAKSTRYIKSAASTYNKNKSKKQPTQQLHKENNITQHITSKRRAQRQFKESDFEGSQTFDFGLEKGRQKPVEDWLESAGDALEIGGGWLGRPSWLLD